MRLALLLPALLLALACKSDSGDETGESGGSSTGCGPADAAAVDPNYPPCDCDSKCADAGAMCFVSQASSVCVPTCTPGPTCGNPSLPCTDSDCPMLAGAIPACDGGRCVLGCDNTKPCPAGYVCGGHNACEVEL